MWVIFGNRVKTERVPNGLKVERACPACGETAMFYERRATTTLQVYFLDVYDYKTQRVMACGACGALFATDEYGGAGEALPETTPGRVLDSVLGAAQRAGQVIQAGAVKALHSLGNELEHLAGDVRAREEHMDEAARRRAEDASAEGTGEGEPVERREGEPRVTSAEDAELLRRLEQLERQAKKPE